MKGDERSDEEEEESQDEAQQHHHTDCYRAANGLANGHWLKCSNTEDMRGRRLRCMSILGTKNFHWLEIFSSVSFRRLFIRTRKV